MAGALIVLASLGAADFAWLDGLRRQHFPPERNRVPAHLTLFHTLPPSAEDEVRRSLGRFSVEPVPAASLAGLIDLGGGVAFKVRSDALAGMRAEMAEQFLTLLTAQDRQGWRPHITIQNKVSPGQARKLLRELEQGFEPRPLAITGLEMVRYVDGEWQPIATWSFRGVS